MTHQYELMVILDPEIDERTVAPSLDKFLNVIRTDGGTVDKVDIWGRRRLAYEINKKNEGIYAVINFTANSAATVELDRQLKLSEAVMRTKVLRAEEGMAQVAAAKKLAEEKAARKRSPEAPVAAATPTKAPVVEKAPKLAPPAAVVVAEPVVTESVVTESVDAEAVAQPDDVAKRAGKKSAAPETDSE